MCIACPTYLDWVLGQIFCFSYLASVVEYRKHPLVQYHAWRVPRMTAQRDLFQYPL